MMKIRLIEKYRSENSGFWLCSDLGKLSGSQTDFADRKRAPSSRYSRSITTFSIRLSIHNKGSKTRSFFPFSVFVYAVFEEARPKKAYWHFIMFYT